MLIRDITNYLQGKLSEDEIINLWEKLLFYDEAFKMLEMMLMLRALQLKGIGYEMEKLCPKCQSNTASK